MFLKPTEGESAVGDATTVIILKVKMPSTSVSLDATRRALSTPPAVTKMPLGEAGGDVPVTKSGGRGEGSRTPENLIT